MIDLSQQDLQECNKTSKAATADEITRHLVSLSDWHLFEASESSQLQRVFTFKDFASAVTFANQLAELAEEHNHHPCLCIEWGKVKVNWWTHVINGLHINDFIMAAKCDAIYNH